MPLIYLHTCLGVCGSTWSAFAFHVLPCRWSVVKEPAPLRHCCTHTRFAQARQGFHHNMVDDIRHFLLECPAYHLIRSHPKYSAIFTMPQPNMPASAQLRHIFAHQDQRLLAECTFQMCFQFLRAMAKLKICQSPYTISLEEALDLHVSIPAVLSELRNLSRGFLRPHTMGVTRCPRSCAGAHVTAATYRYWVGMTDTRKGGGHPTTCHMQAGHRFTLTRLRLGCSDLRGSRKTTWAGQGQTHMPGSCIL